MDEDLITDLGIYAESFATYFVKWPYDLDKAVAIQYDIETKLKEIEYLMYNVDGARVTTVAEFAMIYGAYFAMKSKVDAHVDILKANRGIL